LKSQCIGVFVSLGLAVFASGSELEAVLRALEQRRFEDALQLVTPLVDRSPRDARPWTLKGIALSGLGRTVESLASYKEALKRNPAYLPALQGAAEVEFRLRDPNTRADLEKVLAQQPDNATAHGMLGVLAYERQDCGEAVRRFEKSGDALQQNPAALWQFGHCLFTIGKPGEAADVFRRLLDAQPDNDRMRFNLGLALHEAGRHGEAVERLRPLLERAVPDSDLLSLLAETHEAARQTSEALEVLQRAVKLYPREERHYVDLADLCLEHSSFDLGLEILEIGLKNIPRSSSLHAMKGVLYGRLARFEEAEAEFAQASRLEPNKEYGKVGLSLILQRTGREQESLQLLREHVSRNPRDAAANFMLAQTLLQRNAEPGGREFDEARSALVRAVESKPDLAGARASLGKLYLRAGETAKAIEELKRAVELDPGDRTATYQLMIALREAGREAELAPLLTRLRTLIHKDAKTEAEAGRFHLVKTAPERKD
jgi:tetratricopeptide (TPR) repeat protein